MAAMLTSRGLAAMPFSQTTVIGTLQYPDGDPAVGVRVEFEFDCYDLEPGEGFILPQRQTVITDGLGNFSVDLWPNTEGAAGSRYRVRAYYENGKQLLKGAIIVNEAENPIQLDGLWETDPNSPVGLSVRLLKQVFEARDTAVDSANAALVSEQNAKDSENAAATSEQNAASSEDAAAASETAAATSEQNASNSESAAAASETAAALSEQNAASSEDAAAASETAAALSEQNAASSKDAAAASQTAAASSEQNAKSSENAAATSEQNAANSETAAAASETAAALSEQNAANSESAAAASETAAATSEQNAKDSETAAGNYESQAAVSAGNAADSEAEAATSATAAAGSASSADDYATAAQAARDVAIAARDSAQTYAANSEDSATASEASAQRAEDIANELAQQATGAIVSRGVWDPTTGAYPATPETASMYIVINAPNGVMFDNIEWYSQDQLLYITEGTAGTGWYKVDNSDSVTSVNGKKGTVTLTKGDVGLGNVRNVSSYSQSEADSAFDAAGTAQTFMQNHLAASNPHNQYTKVDQGLMRNGVLQQVLSIQDVDDDSTSTGLNLFVRDGRLNLLPASSENNEIKLAIGSTTNIAWHAGNFDPSDKVDASAFTSEINRVDTDIAGKVSKSGDTISGNLGINGRTSMGNQLVITSNGHLDDEDDYGIRISAFEPSVVFQDRSSGAGVGAIQYNGSALNFRIDADQTGSDPTNTVTVLQLTPTVVNAVQRINAQEGMSSGGTLQMNANAIDGVGAINVGTTGTGAGVLTSAYGMNEVSSILRFFDRGAGDAPLLDINSVRTRVRKDLWVDGATQFSNGVRADNANYNSHLHLIRGSQNAHITLTTAGNGAVDITSTGAPDLRFNNDYMATRNYVDTAINNIDIPDPSPTDRIVAGDYDWRVQDFGAAVMYSPDATGPNGAYPFRILSDGRLDRADGGIDANLLNFNRGTVGTLAFLGRLGPIIAGQTYTDLQYAGISSTQGVIANGAANGTWEALGRADQGGGSTNATLFIRRS